MTEPIEEILVPSTAGEAAFVMLADQLDDILTDGVPTEWVKAWSDVATGLIDAIRSISYGDSSSGPTGLEMLSMSINGNGNDGSLSEATRAAGNDVATALGFGLEQIADALSVGLKRVATAIREPEPVRPLVPLPE